MVGRDSRGGGRASGQSRDKLGDDSLLHYDRAILQAGVPCGEKPAAVIP